MTNKSEVTNVHVHKHQVSQKFYQHKTHIVKLN